MTLRHTSCRVYAVFGLGGRTRWPPHSNTIESLDSHNTLDRAGRVFLTKAMQIWFPSSRFGAWWTVARAGLYIFRWQSHTFFFQFWEDFPPLSHHWSILKQAVLWPLVVGLHTMLLLLFPHLSSFRHSVCMCVCLCVLHPAATFGTFQDISAVHQGSHSSLGFLKVFQSFHLWISDSYSVHSFYLVIYFLLLFFSFTST